MLLGLRTVILAGLAAMAAGCAGMLRVRTRVAPVFPVSDLAAALARYRGLGFGARQCRSGGYAGAKERAGEAKHRLLPDGEQALVGVQPRRRRDRVSDLSTPQQPPSSPAGFEPGLPAPEGTGPNSSDQVKRMKVDGSVVPMGVPSMEVDRPAGRPTPGRHGVALNHASKVY